MRARRWLALDGLAIRFSVLLAVALIAANVIAAALLYIDRQRQINDSLIERELERIVSLVPAIEAAAPERRSNAARAASTRVSRISVDPTPMVEMTPRAPRSAALARALARELGARDVRAAILIRPGWDRDGARAGTRRGTVALSIRLQDDGPGGAQWLNAVSRGAPQTPPGIPPGVLLVTFTVSLISVLAVALLFVRRLTQPLNALSRAAHRAGAGDRTARVDETGPREVRAAAAAFNEMQGRIGQFEAERMRMLAAVGHDLRTPITSLRIRTEMLDEAEAMPMIRTLDEMTVMADGLVTYARGAGDGEAIREVALADLLIHLCSERGAVFEAGAQQVVPGRPVAIGRAVGNLIDNALRYGGAARVRLEASGDDAKIVVDDDGPGIPPDQIAVLMEPFVRGDESRNLETGGAGLGLAIARTIIAAHNGSLALTNRPDGGLRATVLLPRVEPA